MTEDILSVARKYLSNKKWETLPKPDPVSVNIIKSELGVQSATAELLCLRGYNTPELARTFISRSEVLHDPRLLPDMDAAIERIATAIDKGEKIVIYGDYDVDGVTSVSILYLYLQKLGANVSYYIPCRSREGYGMSTDAVQSIAADGVKLIVTVDTGITAIEEIEAARQLGCDVIVTDHHECREVLPEAIAVINPRRADSKYPFCDLAGVGVVFKLMCALEAKLRTGGDMIAATTNIKNEYIELAAIGTIADVMPLCDENRLIVGLGLARIENSRRVGLRALIEASDGASNGIRRTERKRKITSSYVSYTLAPRINAAGRIGDAAVAVELFLTDDVRRAGELARRLCEINRERQLLENEIAKEAYVKIESSHDFDNDPVIVLDDENWNAGIIGIVASRVTEKYGRPSILITFEGSGSEKNDNDEGKGSGRSVAGLNLVEVLGRCSEYLVKYGGHELAAGLTVTRSMLPAFRRAINDIVRCEFNGGKIEVDPVLTADIEIEPDECTLSLADELSLFEPCGVGNSPPVFMTCGFLASAVSGISGDRHTRLTLTTPGGSSVTAMCFGCPPDLLGIYGGEIVDVMYTLDVNVFRGEASAQLTVRALRKNEKQILREEEERCLYEKILEGTEPADVNDIPVREDFSAVYRIIRHEVSMGRSIMPIRRLKALLSQIRPVGYIKLRLTLDVLAELKVINKREIEPDVVKLEDNALMTKVILEKSTFLQRVKVRSSGERI
ncbi:MAG: single-stranded-DNA-specific exonuclease RecJ [Clostridiales bacterium]|nr:single-stranded-DNA-specific exonuclease RecJ [Clostridiales bacterium]